MAFSVWIFALLLCDHPLCLLAVGIQRHSIVSIRSCVFHLLSIWQDRVTSKRMYPSQFFWHSPASYSGIIRNKLSFLTHSSTDNLNPKRLLISIVSNEVLKRSVFVRKNYALQPLRKTSLYYFRVEYHWKSLFFGAVSSEDRPCAIKNIVRCHNERWMNLCDLSIRLRDQKPVKTTTKNTKLCGHSTVHIINMTT